MPSAAPPAAPSAAPPVALAPIPLPLRHSPALIADFFFGVAFNPRVAGVDVKMALYSLGASALVWNALSAACVGAPRLAYGEVPNALALYVGMLLWFAAEYMALEVVHLYTYDLFAEKLGVKIAWGCLVFYPYFYSVGVWPLVLGADEGRGTQELSPATCAAIAALFAVGWTLTRGANLQKYLFKTRGAQGASRIMAGMPMTVVPGTRLLCSGFWGCARHVNCEKRAQCTARHAPRAPRLVRLAARRSGRDRAGCGARSAGQPGGTHGLLPRSAMALPLVLCSALHTASDGRRRAAARKVRRHGL